MQFFFQITTYSNFSERFVFLFQKNTVTFVPALSYTRTYVLVRQKLYPFFFIKKKVENNTLLNLYSSERPHEPFQHLVYKRKPTLNKTRVGKVPRPWKGISCPNRSEQPLTTTLHYSFYPFLRSQCIA